MQAMLSKATVVGSGAMGTVIAQILAGNNINVALLAARSARAQELIQTRENRRYLPGVKLAERVRPTADADAAFAGTELIVSAIPCQQLRHAWSTHAGHIPAGVPICSVTKGMEIGTLARPSQILAEFAPNNPVSVLSGPSIALELARYLPATVVVAAQTQAICDFVQAALSTSWFRIYTNLDVIGVEFGGAVKNVIAIAAGILDGLQAGDNAKSALVTRGLVEITRLGVRVGAKPETFVGLAGIGDLITTCISPLGRNRTAGEKIGRGTPVERVVEETASVIEGIPTTRSVIELAIQRGIEMPITRAVHDVLFEQKEPLAAITELMGRPQKAEEPM